MKHIEDYRILKTNENQNKTEINLKTLNISQRPVLYKEHISYQQAEIKYSTHIFYKQIAYIISFLYCIILSLIASGLKVFYRFKIDVLAKELANFYFYVPEMALHKYIELNAFIKNTFTGNGIDLGCGNGNIGSILIKQLKLDDLSGLDFYIENKEAVLKNGYKKFISGDIQSIPANDNNFNYAISICVIEHIPDLKCALSEISRILKPGGKFVFSTVSPLFQTSTAGFCILNRLGLFKKAKRFQQTKDLISQHYHYFDEDRWRHELSLYGFNNITIKGIFSKKQLFIYDILNFQVYWLRFYFANKLFSFLNNHTKLQKLMIKVTETITYFFGNAKVSDQIATHYIISCYKTLEN